MNERIRQLALQAETKEIGYYFFDKEKFAELIVLACARKVTLNEARNILEYFGVEV